MPYALFDRDRQIGRALSTEQEVWKEAVCTGLVSDVPNADQEGGQVLPIGYHVKEVSGRNS